MCIWGACLPLSSLQASAFSWCSQQSGIGVEWHGAWCLQHRMRHWFAGVKCLCEQSSVGNTKKLWSLYYPQSQQSFTINDTSVAAAFTPKYSQNNCAGRFSINKTPDLWASCHTFLNDSMDALTARHGMCFPRASLPIGQDSGIVALQHEGDRTSILSLC